MNEGRRIRHCGKGEMKGEMKERMVQAFEKRQEIMCRETAVDG